MKLTDLTFDKKNARRRNSRASGTIEHSLKELGAGRSIVIDKHGQIITGNGVIENANKAGITEVDVIQPDGTRIIAVQRVDLDLDADPKARQLAIADNRTAELAEWNPEVLAALATDLDLKPYFSAEELSEITGLSDGITDADRPRLFSDEQIVDAAFEHYRATGFPYRTCRHTSCCSKSTNLLQRTWTR